MADIRALEDKTKQELDDVGGSCYQYSLFFQFFFHGQNQQYPNIA